jgi:SAM-dependent methyltransferase
MTAFGPGEAPTRVVDAEGGSSRGVFSCVVDADPRFHLDALRWYATLTRIVGVDPRDMVVHTVDTASSEVLAFLRSTGVTIVDVAAFDARSPHCNKISGALALAEHGIEGMAVLTDTDVVFLEDPRGVTIEPDSLGMRLVGSGNPPLDVLEKVFDTAGVTTPGLVPLELVPGQSTLRGHGNGGLYLVPGPALPRLARAWARWARWVLAHLDLLGGWSTFVDQTAMTLALADEGIGCHSLGIKWNFPSQKNPERIATDVEAPSAIHYHTHLTNGGLLRPTGVGTVDERIGVANAGIAAVWHEAFPNATFWDWRYRCDPDRGSGLGSRGQPLAEKRALITALVEILEPQSVLDVGCGDGEATQGLPLGHYTGMDVSAEAVRRARQGRSDGDYRLGPLSEHTVSAELTMCLDVLIHQADASAYRRLVGELLGTATRALLVSGYEEAPGGRSPIVHFHEPLSETLTRLEPRNEIYPLREVHGIKTFLVVKPADPPVPADLKAFTLAGVVDRVIDPMLLLALRLTARAGLGFFPDDAASLWEAPSVARLLLERSPAPRHVARVGTAPDPVGSFLRSKGFAVTSLDPAARGVPHDGPIDAAYSFDGLGSVSSEHRQAQLSALASLLAPGAPVFATCRLLRGTDELWSERPRTTGGWLATVEDVASDARMAGLKVRDVTIVRDWAGAPADPGVVVLERRASSGRSLRRVLPAVLGRPH